MEKDGTFSLFETSANGNVTFAYIMTFYCTSVYTRQILNENNITLFTDGNCLSVKLCMLYTVCRYCKQDGEFLRFVWTDCWGNKSYYVITCTANSPAKCYVIIHRYQVYLITLYLSWTTIELITTQKSMEHWCIVAVAWSDYYCMT